MKAEDELILTTALADEIAYRLQRKILEGHFPPGTHITQDALCKLFRVSRTPVREALRKLQAEHLVLVIPNKGAMVRGFSRKDLDEVFALRAELEGLGCELAATRITPGALAEMESYQSILDYAVIQFENGSITPEEEASFSRTINSANEDFHRVIYRAADNNHLLRMIEKLRDSCPKDYLWQSVRVSKGGFRELNSDEHRRVLESLRSADAAGAREAIAAHILHAGAALLDYLESKGFWKEVPSPS